MARRRTHKRGHIHRYTNPNWDGMVDSLLRLGDITKNTHVGEIRSALSKAQELIRKYGLAHYQTRLDDAIRRLEHYEKTGQREAGAHERGSSSSSSSSGSSSSGGGFNQSEYEEWFRRWKAHAQERREQRKRGDDGTYHEGSRRRRRRGFGERQEGAHERTRRRRGSKYGYNWKIVWLVKYNPKRKSSAAGKRWEAYYGADTVAEFLRRGGRESDIKYNINKGYMKVELP